MERANPLETIWFIIILTVTTAMAVISPLDVNFAYKHTTWYMIVNLGISFIFLADIPYLMRRIRRFESIPAFGGRTTMSNYLRFWLIWDVIAVIPFTLLPIPPVFGLLRMTKLLRVGRSMYFWQHRELRRRSTLRLTFAIYWMVLIMHGIACGWLGLRGIEEARTFAAQYTDALYWAVTTVTTVGYGDISAETTVERLYSIVSMIIGLAFYGYFIGNVASLLSKQDPAKTAYLENLERLSMAVKHRGLPADLQMKLFEYYTYIWRKKIGFYESDFVDKLPPGLRREVASFMKKDVIEKVPLFMGASSNFVMEVSVMLKPELASPGEFLFELGDVGNEMFFIVKGELEVIGRDGTIQNILVDGDYFGEIALFMDVKRTAGIRARTYCELYTLSKESFDYVIGRYPGIKSKIEKKVRERLPDDVKSRGGYTTPESDEVRSKVEESR